jgi:hypothetical protein
MKTNLQKEALHNRKQMMKPYKKTLDMNTSQHTDEIENLNPVRRSTRERRQPAWLRSGEFDICKSAISTTADWEKKVSCILNLATNSPIFQTVQAESGQAILSILSTSKYAVLRADMPDGILPPGGVCGRVNLYILIIFLV